MGLLDRFLTEVLGLTKAPEYLPTFFWAVVGFTFVHLIIAPLITRRWFPFAYDGKTRIARNNWNIHVVSQVHALIVVPFSLYCIFSEGPERGKTARDRTFGWDPLVGHVQAIAAGYFLWDTLDAIVNFIDPGFVAHGLACFLVYSLSYRPFVAYYATRCLLWETSTIFLNNHWFLDKTNRTGGKLQLINGGLLLAAFFFLRIVYGLVITVQFLSALREVWDEVPLLYVIVYGVGNVVLQGLNWFWFHKMISALRRRFDSEEQHKLITPEGAPNEEV